MALTVATVRNAKPEAKARRLHDAGGLGGLLTLLLAAGARHSRRK